MEVAVYDAVCLLRGEIRDLSLEGCYVRTSARSCLKLGAEVELRFSLQGAQIKCLARVLNIRAGAGAGFGFLNLEGKSRAGIEGLIQLLGETANAQQAEQ